MKLAPSPLLSQEVSKFQKDKGQADAFIDFQKRLETRIAQVYVRTRELLGHTTIQTLFGNLAKTRQIIKSCKAIDEL
jgi:hypothetical protein